MSNPTPFAHHRWEQLQSALEGMGRTHDLADIVEAIARGEMQSFAEGETWCVTQMLEMPRKKVLEIVLLIGEMAEAEAMYERVLGFGAEHGCTLVRTFARQGWTKKARERGWKNGYCVFLKEIGS